MFNFKPEIVQWKRPLGKGAFEAVVYPYQKAPEDMKWIVNYVAAKNDAELLACFSEIVVSYRCESPYVLPIRGYFIDHDQVRDRWHIYIKLPRMEKSLQDVMNEHKRDNKLIPKQVVIQYFYELIRGVQYLHERGISHRDIKADNICIDAEGHIKIANFGLGNFNQDESSTHATALEAGTYLSAAPEKKDQNVKPDKKKLFMTNLWSLGMVMFQLCTLAGLGPLFSEAEITENGLSSRLQQYKGEYGDIVIKLILSLLREKPSERKSLDKIHQELMAAYGSELQVEDIGIAQSKQLTEIEKQLKAKDDDILKMESLHQKALQGLETRYRKIIFDHELKLKAHEKEIAAKNAKIKELEGILDELKPREVKNDIQMLKADLERKWGTLFYFDDLEKGLLVNMKNYENMKIDSMKLFMNDLTQRHQSEGYRSLQHLKIVLSNWYSESVNGAVRELSDQIGSKMQNLVSLTLKLNVQDLSHIYLTDKTVNFLSAKIGANLQSLQQLFLNFDGQIKLTDKAVMAVATEIAGKCKTLNHFVLDFGNNEQITDDGLMKLASSVASNLKELQHLQLEFSYCPKITDEGIVSFSAYVKELKKLQHVNLGFIRLSDDPQITRETKEFVFTCFKPVPNRNIRLD